MSPQGSGPKKGTGYRSPMKAVQKKQKATRKAKQLERKYPGRAAGKAKKGGTFDPVIGRVKPGKGKK
ncbi:MAG: hypothetical protein V3R87_02830 [Dehalococcoidia bacterium]